PKSTAPTPPLPLPPPPPPTEKPPRFEVPSPCATTTTSPVDVSMARKVIATFALPDDLPTEPTPYLLPKPPPPTLLLLFSEPNLVMLPVMMYLTPSAFCSCAIDLALGSARSLFQKFCSARIGSVRF